MGLFAGRCARIAFGATLLAGTLYLAVGSVQHLLLARVLPPGSRGPYPSLTERVTWPRLATAIPITWLAAFGLALVLRLVARRFEARRATIAARLELASYVLPVIGLVLMVPVTIVPLLLGGDYVGNGYQHEAAMVAVLAGGLHVHGFVAVAMTLAIRRIVRGQPLRHAGLWIWAAAIPIAALADAVIRHFPRGMLAFGAFRSVTTYMPVAMTLAAVLGAACPVLLWWVGRAVARERTIVAP